MNRDTDAPSPVDPDERWTVGRLLTWTTDYLKRRGAESHLTGYKRGGSIFRCTGK